MQAQRIAAAALALALLPAQAPVQLPAYAEGQVWEYKTRPGDEGSLLRIQSIEQLPAFAKDGPVYHISVVGFRYQGVSGAGQLQHAPVSRQTLDASVKRLSASTVKFPDATAGIQQWRQAEGGVFTIPVAKILDALDFAMQRATGGPST